MPASRRSLGEDWWFLTYLGWSHTEAGNAGTGRAVTEQAMVLRPENGNAAHALSHALFEQGDMEAGRTFLSGWLPAHDRASFLHGHLSWHVALAALEAGDLDGALEIYRQCIKPSAVRYPPMNVFTGLSASLLWRLSLAGKTGLEPHWHEVAAYGDRFFPRAGVHFADLHYALVAAATGSDALETRLAELETLAADHRLAPGSSAIDLCRGIRAFAEGDNDSAIRILEPLMSCAGADRRQPCPARVMGGHADRGVSARRTAATRQRSIIAGSPAATGHPARDEAWSQQAAEMRP